MRRSWQVSLLLLPLCLFPLATFSLVEMSGFHCMMRHSMRLNRRIHGIPKEGPPPFDLRVFDGNGRETAFYAPGETYTIRLVGFVHYRGLLLQARLCDGNGFLIGSLKGGRFIEDSNWENYGIRHQQCDPNVQLNDSVTHADDSRKFLTQMRWTTSEDIGNVQFMLTICEENEVCWERWRPRTGLLQPHSRKNSPQPIIEEVFTDEKAAVKLAGIKTL
uniref:Reelin domain-containing protein n=1 Tax=Steinernema glaseri TaxID=37863 RepID=A0A1I8AK47_9BILA